MKIKIMMAVIAVSAFTFAGCGNATENNAGEKVNPDSSKTVSSAKVSYACPMDPEVVSDTPAVCPKCGMDLEKVEAKDTTKK